MMARPQTSSRVSIPRGASYRPSRTARRQEHQGVPRHRPGALSWNTVLQPGPGCSTRSARMCSDIEVVKVTSPPISGQAYIGARGPANAPARHESVRLDRRDPCPAKSRAHEFKYQPMDSLMSTQRQSGVSGGCRRNYTRSMARTATELWKHNNGIGHHGGVISLHAGGKQYVAVVSGWGSHVSGKYGPWFAPSVHRDADRANEASGRVQHVAKLKQQSVDCGRGSAPPPALLSNSPPCASDNMRAFTRYEYRLAVALLPARSWGPASRQDPPMKSRPGCEKLAETSRNYATRCSWCPQGLRHAAS